MKRASFEKWMAAVAAAGLIGVGACGGNGATRGVTLPIVSVPARVIVTPASVSLGFGVPYQFHAVVEDSAGAPTRDQAVQWSLSPSSATIAITDSGVVTGTCYPGGMATVVARSAADSTVFGTAQAFVVSTWTGVSIASVVDAGTGQPANLDSVTDSVRVETSVARPAPPCLSPYELDLVVHRAAGDTTVDRVAVDSTSLPSGPVALTFHSDAKVGGVAQFPNGQYALRTVLLLNGGSPPVPSSTMNFAIKNP
ncbi:MAG: hypothetical protein KGN74_08350 [Gemmatimonadota bacterium]|nr:hypothetical protein [Gemmatimonadota bacterium]